MTYRLFNLLIALLVMMTSPALALEVQYDEQAEHEEQVEKHEKLQKLATVPRAHPAPEVHERARAVTHADRVLFRDTGSTHTIPPRQLTERRQN